MITAYAPGVVGKRSRVQFSMGTALSLYWNSQFDVRYGRQGVGYGNLTDRYSHFQAPQVWGRAQTEVGAGRWAALHHCRIFWSFLVSQA